MAECAYSKIKIYFVAPKHVVINNTMGLPSQPSRPSLSALPGIFIVICWAGSCHFHHHKEVAKTSGSKQGQFANHEHIIYIYIYTSYTVHICSYRFILPRLQHVTTSSPPDPRLSQLSPTPEGRRLGRETDRNRQKQIQHPVVGCRCSWHVNF